MEAYHICIAVSRGLYRNRLHPCGIRAYVTQLHLAMSYEILLFSICAISFYLYTWMFTSRQLKRFVEFLFDIIVCGHQVVRFKRRA